MDEQLVDAEKKRDLSQVNQLIAHNAPVNIIIKNGSSLLGEAAADCTSP